MGNDQIAHVSESNKVVYLNLSAQVLLELCDGTRQADEICRTLCEQFGLNPQDLIKEIASALGSLAVEKLVQVDGSILDELASCYCDQIIVTHVRFGEVTLRVQTTCPAAAAEVRERFQRLLAPPDERESMNLDIIPINGLYDQYVYIHQGTCSSDASQFSAIGTLDYLKTAVIEPFKWKITDCAWFHAGAVAKNLRSAIVTGAPGSGKSNITAELCHRGWEYLSDEVLPISVSRLQALPYPVTPLPRQYSTDFLPDHRLWEIERNFVELPENRICRQPTTPVVIFLPCYTPGSEARLEPMDVGIAATAMLNNCTSLRWRGTQAIEVVTRLLERVQALKLLYDDVPSACDRIEAFFAKVSS